MPAGAPTSEYKYRDFTITADPTDGYNVLYHFLSNHLGEGELAVYVKETYKPDHYTEGHLALFPQDPNEKGTYEKFIHDEHVGYLGKFKIVKSAG
jgi:hypothetical protein